MRALVIYESMFGNTQTIADGIVERTVYREVPPRVAYSLTPLGIARNESLIPLCNWGEAHMNRVGAAHRPEACDYAQSTAD